MPAKGHAGVVRSIFRHPVKGLTPEHLASVDLQAGAYFPNDRRWAVEVGPSGFDPAAPRHISKMKFTVLARFPTLAQLRTSYDDATGVLRIGDAHGFGVDVNLDQAEGRRALERFLQAFLGEDASAPLKLLESPPGHRFMDNSQAGFVSAINLNSLRAVEAAIGQAVDPLRFRANIYYDGPVAFDEDALERGDILHVGGARLKAMKPIERCIATHVDPVTGVRDIDMVDKLRDNFGRITLGVYFAVEAGGRVSVGDAVAPPLMLDV